MTSASARRRAAASGAPFRHIVVPTDLTDRTERAVELSFKLSGSRSRLTLLHVVQTVPGLPFNDLRPSYEKLRDRAARKMAAIVKRVTPSGVGVDIKIVYGPRAETIVKTATAMGADLIVLPSHRVNPTMVGRDWGTISYKVGILAQCPVLLVK
jgi:universal stress protein A